MRRDRRYPLESIINRAIKRTVDIFGSLFLMILTSPVMLFAAIGVKATSNGPVIFRQERVGKDGVHFCMYKFRSMVHGSNIKMTSFGRFMRGYFIDELPQLVNVLKGDMSLVGPRPEIPPLVERYIREIPGYDDRARVKPGITGWSQVNGLRGATSINERVRYDNHYIDNWSLIFDIRILFMTLGCIKR